MADAVAYPNAISESAEKLRRCTSSAGKRGMDSVAPDGLEILAQTWIQAYSVWIHLESNLMRRKKTLAYTMYHRCALQLSLIKQTDRPGFTRVYYIYSTLRGIPGSRRRSLRLVFRLSRRHFFSLFSRSTHEKVRKLWRPWDPWLNPQSVRHMYIHTIITDVMHVSTCSSTIRIQEQL